MDHVLTRIETLKTHIVIDPTIKGPEDLRLRSIKAVKIYYCFYGRNAWQSKWVHKYAQNCMHSSFESAKEFAEINRKQGSVFYIEELPALYIESGDYPILITQINKECPLINYSATALKEPDVKLSKINGYRNNYLTFGASLKPLILSFRYDSRFWQRPQAENTTIILYSKNKLEYLLLKTTELKSWKSSSFGKKYYLSWSEMKKNIDPKAVLCLYNESGFNQKT